MVLKMLLCFTFVSYCLLLILGWVAGRSINRCWLFIRCGVANKGHGKGVPLESLFGGTVLTKSLIELIVHIFVDGLPVGAGAGGRTGAV